MWNRNGCSMEQPPRGCSHSALQIGSSTAVLILFLPLFPHHTQGWGRTAGRVALKLHRHLYTQGAAPLWAVLTLAWKMKIFWVWLCRVTCLSSIRAQLPTPSHGSSLPGGSSSCLVHRAAPPHRIPGSRTEHRLLKNTSGYREFPCPSVSLGKHNEIRQREAVWARALLWGAATLSFNLSTAEGLAEPRGGPAPQPSCFTESQNHRIAEAGKDP